MHTVQAQYRSSTSQNTEENIRIDFDKHTEQAQTKSQAQSKSQIKEKAKEKQIETKQDNQKENADKIVSFMEKTSEAQKK